MFDLRTAQYVLETWAPLAQAVSVNPPLLLAIVAKESSGNPQASRQEAHDESRGLAQVLAGTLAQMQTTAGAAPVPPVNPAWTPDDLWDPTINLTVAEAVITRQIAWWSGDLLRAIASYNAGINLRQSDPLQRSIPGYMETVMVYYQWFLSHWQGAPPLGPEPDSSGSPGPTEPAQDTGDTARVTVASAGALGLGLLLAVALLRGFRSR